ncbi:MAG: cation:proton antiporter, partial [Kiritimatiellae bacterium]|nr:cation:proton antiporter [Kiritimatiellia bacterium]
LKAIGVWLGGTALGVVLARRISWLLKLFKSPVAISILAFGLSLVIAALFEVLGLTLIIGAYVIGLSLSRTDIKHLIEENLKPVYTFLVPVFFCVMGMMVDLNALCSKPVLVFGGIYTVLAILAKQIGCALPTFLCGFNLKGGLRVGAGMIARGEVALIVAGIGLANGYLTQEIFGIGILMTLVTTVVAPPCLVGLVNLPGEGVRRPHPKSVIGSRNVVFEMSSPMVAELMMVRLVSELRAEGFFLSELSHEDHIWSAAMDDIEFSIQRDGANILFSCTPAEEAMVMTAWMEVASQMNDLARAISKPIRREDVGRILQNPAPSARGRSGVGRYLQGFVMLPKFRAASKREAIERMVSEIARACPNHVKDAAAATAAVLKREDSMPTGLDHGIAVPHGRCAEIVGIAGAVAILDNEGTANGCIPDYETIDNSPLQIIVLTLANDEQQTPYLQLMGFISRALRADAGYKRLLACTSADEMRKFFRTIQ